MIDARALAHSVQDFVVDFRHDIHAHPELAWHEFRTCDRICEELDKAGISYKRMDPTGVLAEVKGKKGEGKTVLLRGDIDALPIHEKTGLPFASTNDGVMHACGHDTHGAMLLGAAKCVKSVEDEFAGTVKFLFQPAEEVGQGAKAMIAQGALENVDYVFGTHIASELECGHIYITDRPSYASAFHFLIRLKGLASHGGAEPHKGHDAAVAGSALVMNLQTMVSREFDPQQPVVVSVGKITCGKQYNIIADTFECEGTIRTFSRELNSHMQEIMERIAAHTAETFRCEMDEVKLTLVAEVLSNDPEAYKIGCEAGEKVAPGMVEALTPTMGGEDFAFYTPLAKGAFFSLGAALPDENGKLYPLHNEHVRMNEAAFETGVALYIQVAMDALAH